MPAGIVVCALALVAVLTVTTVRAKAGSEACIGARRRPDRPDRRHRPGQRVLPRLYSADLALGIVAGYAFADGQIDGGTYTYERATRSGLVWDGPSRPAAESVVTLLASLGVTARLRGTSSSTWSSARRASRSSSPCPSPSGSGCPAADPFDRHTRLPVRAGR